MCRYNSLVTRVTSPCPHMGTEIYTTATTVDGHSLLPIGLLLVGHSGHRCGCSVQYTCASCWQVLLATSRAAPCWALWSLVQLLRKLGCAHATTSVGAATKRRVAKDTALHVQYLLKSILCNSRKQIQQLMNRAAATLSLLYQSPSKSVIPVVQSPRGSPRSPDTGWPIGRKARGSSWIPF